MPQTDRSVSPRSNPDADGSDDAAYWKRRYLALQESVNIETSSKRKPKSASISTLGRGIRKVVFLCGEIKDLVDESDKHRAYLDDPESADLNVDFAGLNEEGLGSLKRDWERSHTALLELCRLIPNFRKKIDSDSPNELSTFYEALQHGANCARSDDLSRIRACVADWLNSANPTPSPLLDPNSRQNRGLQHDTTGRLLCPPEYNWDDPTTRAKLRAGDDGFNWLCSFHSRCFYENYNPAMDNLEKGYLKSPLLIRVYKAIFTSPSSATDPLDEESNIENMPPAKFQRTSTKAKAVRRDVASKVSLNQKVTPRSIAYAATQLHFNLQDAPSWKQDHCGFDYPGLYNYIVDFFEDTPGPAATKRAQDLLTWWSRIIFPSASHHHRSNVSASRKALREQRAALEREAAV